MASYFFGVIKAGAVIVPFNCQHNAEELRHCLNLTECAVLFSDIKCQELINECFYNMKKVPFCVFSGNACSNLVGATFDNLLKSSSSDEPNYLLNSEDNAAIYFTSGTTGYPKAVLLSHSNLEGSARWRQKSREQICKGAFLIIPPLYHVGAMAFWFNNLLVGRESVLLKNPSPQHILATISKEEASAVWLLLPRIQEILEAIECGNIELKKYSLSCWNVMNMAGQSIPNSVVKRWMKVFPSHLCVNNYGLTETAGICSFLELKNICKLGSIGKANEGWEMLILNEEGELLDNNRVGELVVKGPGLMRGYYKDLNATKNAVHGEWLFTGDMAYKDVDGYLYIVGRKKDIIIIGGENVSAVQIENYIHRHAAVKDAAAISIKDDKFGEAILTVIELKSGCESKEDEVLKFLTSLPDYKIPKKVVFGNVLRTSVGKLDKESMRQRYNF